MTPDSPLYIYYLDGRPNMQGLQTTAFLGNWQEDETAFLFFSKPSLELVQGLIRQQAGLRLLDQFQMTYREWQGANQEILDIGGFRICPPDQALNAAGTRIQFSLDPGLVFGNGLHPTTRDCLLALEVAWQYVAVERILDLGTGTGVLALAGAALGARAIIAVDLNLLAVQTTRRNVILNGFQDQILAVQGRAEEMAGLPADVLLANLHFDAMRQLLAADGFQRYNLMILSGLLRSEVNAIKETLSCQNIAILQEWQPDGIWYTLLARRTDTR